jgi:GT2 family glycosyltransferase
VISVIVPCFNCVEYTMDFLRSIAMHTASEHEVILVDDGSTDDTRCLDIYGFSVDTMIIHENNMGLPRSINDAVAAAKGEYIAIFNNDCIAMNEWDLVAALEKYGDMGLVFGQQHFSDAEYFGQEHPQTNLIRVWDRGLPFFMRTEVQKRIGPWDEQFFPSWYDDIDMEIRVVNRGYIFGVAEDSHVIHYSYSDIGKGTSITQPSWGDWQKASTEKFMHKWSLREASVYFDFTHMLATGEIKVISGDEYAEKLYVIPGGLG